MLVKYTFAALASSKGIVIKAFIFLNKNKLKGKNRRAEHNQMIIKSIKTKNEEGKKALKVFVFTKFGNLVKKRPTFFLCLYLFFIKIRLSLIIYTFTCERRGMYVNTFKR